MLEENPPDRVLHVGLIPGKIHAVAKIRAIQRGLTLKSYLITLIEEDAERTNRDAASRAAKQ